MSADEIRQTLSQTLAATDPTNPNAIDPSQVPEVDRVILAASYIFQFEYSRAVLERELGIEIPGAAVPGMPEKLLATLQIIPYYEYLSGGWSGIGSGYPNAFGYLSPDLTDKVYLAPNMSFDFTLIGFQGKTPQEAIDFWANEYASIVNHATNPIIAFPWHDYGATNWDLGSGPGGYTLAMYESVLARAANDGTEFVTGDDLAQRIESFGDAGLEVSEANGLVNVRVTSPDAGKFALTLDGGANIAQVAGWYAWDGDTVFLPRAGGEFQISLGASADVTRLAELPMRAELVTASGDGTNLDFNLIGRGKATVDLKAWGTSTVVTQGADGGSLNGERLTLDFDSQGSHQVGIDYLDTNTVVGSAAKEVILGGSDSERIDGAGGDDIASGGGGSDTFVFGAGSGFDTVLDFLSGADRLELVNSGFNDANEAYSAFTVGTEGLTLNLGAEDRLVLAGLDLTGLTASDISLTQGSLIA
jgi:serralysin